MIIGNAEFKISTYVMAIINLTPDSFYAPSRTGADGVLFAVERAVKEGAAVIDLGAQSTRPGHVQISAEEETERLCGPLLKVKRNFGIPVSVDTFYSQTAAEALKLGADMINDVWGLTYSPDMANVIAAYGASVCIMHNSKQPVQGSVFAPVLGFLQNSVDIALKAGIDKNKILLDGGIGFAKDKSRNFELLNGYEKLSALGYPTLLGCSRKSMFGGKPQDRLPPTLGATVRAYKKGVLFVRVHDVAANVRAINDCIKFGYDPSCWEAYLG